MRFIVIESVESDDTPYLQEQIAITVINGDTGNARIRQKPAEAMY
jgi:hypothetical protein